MAELQLLIDPTDKSGLQELTRRTEDNLLEHVLGDIVWIDNNPHHPIEYYLWIQSLIEFRPVEFVEDHWYFIFEAHGRYFTSPDQHINPYEQGT